jgi:hypothetical protein
LVALLAFAVVFAACDDGSTSSSKSKSSTSSSDDDDELSIPEIVTPEWLQGSWYVVGGLDDFFIFEVKVTPSEIILVSPNELTTTVNPITKRVDRPRIHSYDKDYISLYFIPYSDEAYLRVVYEFFLEEGFRLYLHLTPTHSRQLYKAATVKVFPEILWGKWEYRHYDYVNRYDHRFAEAWNAWSERFEITETLFIEFPYEEFSTYSIIAEEYSEASGYRTLFIGSVGISYALTLHYDKFAWLERFIGGKRESIDIRKSRSEVQE